jgi:hypothetical protein
MILARVRVLRTNTLPERQKACGILVLPVPVVKGAHVVGALLAAILLCLGLGAALWLRQERPLTARQRERARIVGLLAFLLLLTMVISLLGWWGGGIIIIMIIILFLTAVMERFGWQK